MRYIILRPTETQDPVRRSPAKFYVRTQVLDKSKEDEELNVRLQIVTRHDDGRVDLQSAEMWVGFFDFPAIDNIRVLGSDHRCAVVLNQFEKSTDQEQQTDFAKISVIVFPGCRASLKEKAYYEDVVDKLLPQGESRFGGKS